MSDGRIWQERAARLLFVAIILAATYIVLAYYVGVILPFVLAVCIATPTVSLSRVCARRFGGREKAWKMFFLLFGGVIAVLGVVFVIRTAISAISGFAEYITANDERICESLSHTVSSAFDILSRIPLIGSVEGIEQSVKVLVSDAIGTVAGWIGNTIGGVILNAPSVFISLLVAVVAGVYLTLDYERVEGYILSGKRGRVTARVLVGIKAYAKAYFKIFLLTFGELAVGLTLLRRPYAILIALVIAAVDILPMVGSGLILGIWATVLMVNGSVGIGIGMLCLVLVMAIVRQIAEPGIVGRSLGVHPLVSLFVMYVGLRVFGFWGMILSPVGAVAIKEIFGRRQEKRENIEEIT